MKWPRPLKLKPGKWFFS